MPALGTFSLSRSSLSNRPRFSGKTLIPLGIRANARMLDVLMQASFKEGLTKKLARVEEIFYPTTLSYLNSWERGQWPG